MKPGFGTWFRGACLALAGLMPQTVLAAEVRIGLYQNSPKIFTDEYGKPTGIFVDIINEIAIKEGWKLRFVSGTWDECLDGVTRGKIDLMPDVAYSEERSRVFDFNQESVLSSWSQVYSRRGVEIKSILELKGKRVAVLDQSIQQKSMEKLVGQYEISCSVITFGSFPATFQALENGKADVAITNRFFGVANRGKYRVRETSVMFDPASLHFVSKKGANRKLLDAIDGRLKALKAEPASAYFRIMDKWLGPNRPIRMPGYVKWIAISGLLVILLSVAFSAVLKWQLKLRSAELLAQNGRLRTALIELDKAQMEAMRRERLHILGQMASGIAHDFNNVLAPIIGYTELLMLDDKSIKNDVKVRKILGIIGGAAKDGADIVKRMRIFYSEKRNREQKLVGVGALLEEVVALCAPRLNESRGKWKISVERMRNDPPCVYVCESEIREAFMNVMGNSLDAMPKGGDIRVRVGSDNGKVAVSFEDNGEGMTREVLKDCTRPFFTTKGANGTGMGLATTLNIVQRHGGALDVISEPGKGTRITIHLPEAPPSVKDGEALARRYSIKPIRILALDDDNRALESLAALLKVDGHEVETMTNSVQALSRAANSRFDLIIIDHVMPELNGDMLALALKQVSPDSIIIMVTGQDEYTRDIYGQGEHIRKVLDKPVRLNTLRETMVELGFGRIVA